MRKSSSSPAINEAEYVDLLQELRLVLLTQEIDMNHTRWCLDFQQKNLRERRLSIEKLLGESDAMEDYNSQIAASRLPNIPI